jgi:hypothetical protein
MTTGTRRSPSDATAAGRPAATWRKAAATGRPTEPGSADGCIASRIDISTCSHGSIEPRSAARSRRATGSVNEVRNTAQACGAAGARGVRRCRSPA